MDVNENAEAAATVCGKVCPWSLKDTCNSQPDKQQSLSLTWNGSRIKSKEENE